jgi:hypothetical protein
MATQLKSDANFVSKGEYRLQNYPTASAVLVGSFVKLSNGKLAPITSSDSALCIGQVAAVGTAVLASEGTATVRYNGVFEANIASGSTLVSGDVAYLTCDNAVGNYSYVGTGSIAGIYLGLSQNGNALVKHSIDLE